MIDGAKLKQYQDLTMEMLFDFQSLCNEHSLTWLLAGGSALGALRHHGFIPWDDDVDLAMPREDFEQLEAIMKAQENRLGKYVYSPVEAQLIPDAPIGHLYYPGESGDVRFAPKLDIHPIDAVPEDEEERSKQKRYSLIYYLGIYHMPTKNKGKLMHTASSAALKLVSDKNWKKLEKKAKNTFTHPVKDSDCRYVCSIFGAAGYEKETVPKEWLFPVRMTDFNGVSMPVPNDAESYLERLYGDWRQLPEESERHPVHDNYLHYQ